MDSSPDLSSNNNNKVCAIVDINSMPSIFLVDLDFEYDKVDANGFAEMKPNFRFADEPVGYFQGFSVVDSTLYFLLYHRNIPVPKLYSIDLQAASKMSDRVLEMDKLSQCSDCSPKSNPGSVAFRGNLLIFSTVIAYEIEGDVDGGGNNAADAIDFELYDPKLQTYRKLPRLTVHLKGYEYHEHDCDVDCDDGFSVCSIRRCREPNDHFVIVSSAVDVGEDRFIIETDFGRMFSLKLKLDGGDASIDCWRLCDEQGYEIRSRTKNIVTRDGICFSNHTANDSRRRWLQQQQSGQYDDQDHGDGDGIGRKRAKVEHPLKRSVRIPDVEIDQYGLVYDWGPESSSFDLLDLKRDGYMLLCTEQLACDEMAYKLRRCYYYSKLYLVLNVVKVHSPAGNQDDTMVEDNFLERMTSFKFVVSERNFAPLSNVFGLFYY